MDSEEAHNGRGVFGAQSSNLAMSIIGAEDEDFENDLDPTVDDHCSHFNSIELLKGRPTHLLVFLSHVMLQFDCSPVLCYLHADLFRSLSAKETKKQFVEFYNTFLDKGAILRVSVPTSVSSELDRTRPDVLSEDQQRRFAQEVQTMQASEVLRQLDDFRQKRMMGMTLNEAELLEVENHYPTDRIPKEMKEKAVAENLLDKLFDIQLTIVADEEKSSSIFGAVAFYMKTLGVKTRAAVTKKSSRGFFRNAMGGGKTKRNDDAPKAKQRFPSILSAAGGWIGSSTEVKVPKVEVEVEKEKVTPERKGSSGPVPSKVSIPEATPTSFSQRKSGPSGGSASQAGSDVTDGLGINISVTSSPDSSHSDMGLPSSRSDPLSVSEVGDVSPAGLAGGLAIWEAQSPNDTPLEESLDKDSSVEGGLLLPETTGPGPSPTSPVPHQEEMEPRLLELEQDPPNWREQAPASALSCLSKKETKRQEVINELFATEHAHVRMLSVLQTVFSRPLGKEELMTSTELATIFPSLDEIIEMHFAFHESLKKVRQEDNFIVKAIGTTLLNRFGGPEGIWFQKLTARFCSHQSWALDQIKSRQKKDPRFNAFILEAESKPQCRRLQLKDIIPIEMQRLTKYPLLLENIAKSTEDTIEKDSVLRSAECCRRILNHVNEEVKLMENLLTLKDYQRRLDTSGLKPSNELYTEYKNIDLTSKRMIYEGPLIWRVTKEKALDVQCVLLGDLLVLFQKQDDKMTLKCQSKSNIAVQEGKQMLSPIIKLDSAFLREVATDRKAFYVIFTWDSGAQIYELVAQSVGERKTWTDVIKTAVDELKQSGAPVVDRSRIGSLTPVGVGSPFSNAPPLSPTENGGDSLKSIDQDKDSLTDEKTGDSRHSVIDYLSEKGFVFDLIGEQEKVANDALDEVMSLKRLLVGSISLSEDSQPDEENGGGVSERQDHESDVCQSTEEGHYTDVSLEQEDGGGGSEGGGEDGEMKGEEDGGISAPLVLSQERMEEVRRKLQSLEEQLKKLQSVEEEHHRLQEALSKFSLEGGNFQ